MGAGVRLQAARSELNSMVAELGKRQAPNFHTLNPQAHTATMFSFHEEVIGNVRTAMLVLLGAVAFFLLIACVNVANLLLARSDSRQREIAVRTAVGAGNLQLLRQFVEGVILSSLGAILGVGLATTGVNAIIATNPGARRLPQTP